MSRLVPDPRWTASQKAFVAGLEQLGATAPEHAMPIDRSLAPSAPELQALIDSGIVREASSKRYYVHPTQVPLATASPAELRLAALKARLEEASLEGELAQEQRERRPYDGRRILKIALFWIIVILIPMIMLQLFGPDR
ncbi:MAG TPA: hypothetical protein VFO55_09125 [Gemmatimonadaceae bacterium]|nr:hypothetical protein [Gemmatimonadaceae bacterium]